MLGLHPATKFFSTRSGSHDPPMHPWPAQAAMTRPCIHDPPRQPWPTHASMTRPGSHDPPRQPRPAQAATTRPGSHDPPMHLHLWHNLYSATELYPSACGITQGHFLLIKYLNWSLGLSKLGQAALGDLVLSVLVTADWKEVGLPHLEYR